MDVSSLITAIVTSFIASVMFYLSFEFVPKKKKYHIIRPRIEVELMEISTQLFFFIEYPMRHSMHSPSLFQDDIREGRLTQNDYEIGLYNKCINESYLFDENASKLIIVGDELKKQSDLIESSIQRVLMNQEYLNAEEILILEDVIRLLHTYSFDTNAILYLGTVKLCPVNPTISYMHKNYYELYKCYKELCVKLHSCKEIRHEKRQGMKIYYSIQHNSIICLISDKEYDKAIKKIRYLLRRYDSSFAKTQMNALLLRINIERNQIDRAKEHLNALLNDPNRNRLVYQRGYLQCIRGNNELMMLCKSCCSADEINEWETTVLSERTAKEAFLAQNRALKDYYEKKTRSKTFK